MPRRALFLILGCFFSFAIVVHYNIKILSWYNKNMTTYVIVYDPNRDIDNWLSVAQSPVSHGKNFYDNLGNDADRQMFKDLQNLPTKQARAKLEKYLKQKVKSAEFLAGEKFIRGRYEQDFQKACDWLEKVTKKPLAFSKYTIYLTTFPCCPYNPNEGYMYDYYGWVNPISGFMHEALHIQFHRYWRDDPESPVSKLSGQDWEILKESLTVVLNKKYVDFVELDDRGYAAHQEFRKKLWQCWEKEQDFAKLVEYGSKEVTKFTQK